MHFDDKHYFRILQGNVFLPILVAENRNFHDDMKSADIMYAPCSQLELHEHLHNEMQQASNDRQPAGVPAGAGFIIVL